MFDAAVLLRTLYTAIGPEGWRLYISGLGGKLPLKLLSESRVPVSVATERVTVNKLPEPQGRVYVVDPRGIPAWSLEAPDLLVIDYTGMARRLYSGATPVSAAGLPALTYEAAALIYEFVVRRRSWEPDKTPFSRDPRQGLYLARKMLEAVTVFDNYIVLEPTVITYTLRRVYLSKGLLIDPEAFRIDVDPVSGTVREEVRLRAYNRRLKPKGCIVAKFDGFVLLVEDWEGTAFKITVDAAHMKACAAPGLCVSRSEEEQGGRVELWPAES